MITSYCSELDREIEFVQAIRDYVTNGDSSLLSFHKGDIIKLASKSYTPRGWLRGVLNGHVGLFPVEYVRPIKRSELNDFNLNQVRINQLLLYNKLFRLYFLAYF